MSWLLLTSGRGPGECQLAVAGLVEALCAEAREEAEVLDAHDGSHGPFSALVALRGAGAEALARSWEGTVRWTCPSPLREGWPRKNWYVGVSRLAPPPPDHAAHPDRSRVGPPRSQRPEAPRGGGGAKRAGHSRDDSRRHTSSGDATSRGRPPCSR